MVLFLFGCGREVDSVIKGNMRVEFLLSLLLYFIILILICLLFSKRMKNLEDFFLASRRLPLVLVYASLVASWFGATSILVTTDEAFTKGVSAIWLMGVPAILTVLLFGFFLSQPIRRLPIVSLPDLVEMRYGSLVRHLASLLIIWYMILLASSQMVAIGHVLKSLLGTSYLNGLLIGTGVVLVYSVLGGFFSVALTDGLQFLLLAAGIFGLFFFLSTTSSLGQVSLFSSPESQSHLFQIFYNVKENLLIVLSFTFAWTVSPIVWQRIQAARSEEEAQQALFYSSGTFLILYGLLVLIGILSLPLFFSRSLEGPLLSEIISSKTPLLLGCLLFVAIVAAIMSTMDTAINTGALSLTRDVYQQFFSSSPRYDVLASRLLTLAVGILAFLVATRFQSILKMLGLSSEIMAEGLFIPGIAMIFLKKRRPTAGLLSLLLGGGFSLLIFFSEVEILPFQLVSWPYSVPYGVGLCALGFTIGMVVDRYRK